MKLKKKNWLILVTYTNFCFNVRESTSCKKSYSWKTLYKMTLELHNDFSDYCSIRAAIWNCTERGKEQEIIITHSPWTFLLVTLYKKKNDGRQFTISH